MSPEEQLDVAITNSDVDGILYAIQNGADVNIKITDYPIITGLYDIHLTKFLIERGADINVENERPLFLVTDRNNIEISELLLLNGANPNNEGSQILNNLLSNLKKSTDFIPMLDLLLKYGLDINRINNNWIRILTQSPNLYNVLVERGLNQENQAIILRERANFVLMSSISSKNYDKAVEAIERGADANMGDGEPLSIAISKQSVRIIKLLISKGADINARNGYAIKKSISDNNLNIVDILLKNKADLSVLNDNDYINIVNSLYHLREQTPDRNQDFPDNIFSLFLINNVSFAIINKIIETAAQSDLTSIRDFIIEMLRYLNKDEINQFLREYPKYNLFFRRILSALKETKYNFIDKTQKLWNPTSKSAVYLKWKNDAKQLYNQYGKEYEDEDWV